MCIRIDDNHQIGLAKCTTTTTTIKTLHLWPDAAAPLLAGFYDGAFRDFPQPKTDLRLLSENYMQMKPGI